MNVMKNWMSRCFGCLFLAIALTSMTASADEPPREGGRERESVEQRESSSFVPQNDRERELLRMINALRAEVASLRRQMGSRDGQRRDSGEASRERSANSDRPRGATAANNRVTMQAKRIFAAYDKNKDQSVSFDEWLAMREGEMTSERRERERGHFDDPAGDDGKITPDEFLRWMIARSQGRAAREGHRDGDARREGSRSPEGVRDGAGRRDGDSPRERDVRRDGAPRE